MRSKAVWDNLPSDIQDQMDILLRNGCDLKQVIEYLKLENFAKARGLSGARTEEQIIDELRHEIKYNLVGDGV